MSDIHAKPGEIEYLSVEGGGGKGFAYLGAIDAFNSIEGWDWNKLKGFSGSSAGAITAMLLSIGYTTEKQIKTFLVEKIRPEAFFEPANPRYIPSPGGFIKAPAIPNNLDIATTILRVVLIFLLIEIIQSRNLYTQTKGVTISLINTIIRDINNSINTAKRLMLRVLIEIVKLILIPDAVEVIVPRSVWKRLESLADNIRLKPLAEIEVTKERDVLQKTIDVAIEQLKKSVLQLEKEPDSSLLLMLDYLPQAFIYLFADLGLFHGKKARDIFDEEIANAMGQSGKNVTFKQHSEHKGFKKLVVTGTNLTTGKTVLFSADETPDFPVADAVRISMSLPFIFKPYVIDERRKGFPPCGVYVDGGVFNNSPLHAFDDEIWEAQEEAQRNSFSLPLSKAIGLRLTYEKPYTLPVRDSLLNFFYPFLWTIALNGIFGTGESQVLRREENRYILLDNHPLWLLGFNPPKDDKVFKRSRRAVYRHFGLQPDPKDVDETDDRESAKRKRESDNPCGE